MLVASGAILSVFIGSRQSLTRPGGILSSLAGKAAISMGSVQQTATRDGKKEWSLSASSARLMDSKKEAFFNDLSITFFTKDENRIYLTASRGILTTDSKNIEVHGNVIVQNGDYQLKTEQLSYLHDRRVIFSKVPVTISGHLFNFVADSMRFDLNSNTTSFKGNVRGLFHEKIPL